jgi:DNA (cytosine-5)-methyltransferase 1
MKDVDLFAGVGWDLAGRELGIDPLGIDTDPDVCATREALGMRTLQADVAALVPRDFRPVRMLIASPPCTAFSMAGNGKGRAALDAYTTVMQQMRDGAPIDREWLDRQCDDQTAHLVLEPLRWALALSPELIACEQVPPVLPLWKLMAEVLADRGYSVWTGILEAERYGVPQTRRRAILMASRTGVVHPPAPTHQRFVPGEPAYHEVTLEGGVLPWVSMADALGWGTTGRPSVITEKARTATWEHTPDHLDVRQVGAQPRPVSDPAPTMLSEGLAKGVPVWRYRNGPRQNAAVRTAPTPHFGHQMNDVSWVVETNNYTEKGGKLERFARSGDRPSRVTGGARLWRHWTTVNGDPRISPPGHHDENESGSQQKNAVRVTVREAAILQGFPDIPWQGSRTAQFRQIGNAVPPPLAKAILSALLEAI